MFKTFIAATKVQKAVTRMSHKNFNIERRTSIKRKFNSSIKIDKVSEYRNKFYKIQDVFSAAWRRNIK